MNPSRPTQPTGRAYSARRLRRIAAVTTLAAGTLFLGTGTAFAHIDVSADEVAPGGYSKLTFRVPNESPTADIRRVEIVLPPETPFASVRVKHLAGWSIDAITSPLPSPVAVGDVNLTEAVSSVVFTAEPGSEVGPGEFGEFDIRVGEIPDVEQIVFNAIETYSDGEVVNWSEVPADGAEEPEFPAPILTVTGEPAGDHGGAAAASPSVEDEDTSSAPLIFGVSGTVIGLAGLGVAILALRRRNTPAGNPATAATSARD